MRLSFSKSDLAEAASHWYSGQSDPLYAIACMRDGGKHLTPDIIEDALHNAVLDYDKMKAKKFKGMKREDVAELRFLIAALEEWGDSLELKENSARAGGISELVGVVRGPSGKFPLIAAGKYWLSVQGSEEHYSRPRRDLPNLVDYDKVEIAILNSKKTLVSPEGMEPTPPWADLFEDGRFPVAPYVEIGLVPEILADLRDM